MELGRLERLCTEAGGFVLPSWAASEGMSCAGTTDHEGTCSG
jgi:hypothetical protein